MIVGTQPLPHKLKGKPRHGVEWNHGQNDNHPGKSRIGKRPGNPPAPVPHLDGIECMHPCTGITAHESPRHGSGNPVIIQQTQKRSITRQHNTPFPGWTIQRPVVEAAAIPADDLPAFCRISKGSRLQVSRVLGLPRFTPYRFLHTVHPTHFLNRVATHTAM